MEFLVSLLPKSVRETGLLRSVSSRWLMRSRRRSDMGGSLSLSASMD
jgi:hypothetical protein